MTRLIVPAAALALAFLATLACRAATGVSLGLFIGGVGFATLIVPPLVAGEATLARRCLVALAATLGVALAWLTAIGEPVTLAQWFACTVALAAYAFILCGICALLLSMRCNAPFAAALVTTLGLLWLTWPVWLSHALLQPRGDALVEWLVPAHPLFAINGVLEHMGTWDRQPLAYNTLTVLDQHVFYELPPSVKWATVTHVLIAAMALGISAAIERRRASRAAAAARPTDAP